MFDDPYLLRDRARSAAARGDLDGAIAALLEAAAYTHVTESDYLAVLRPLSEALSRREDPRRALTVLSYIASTDVGAWKLAEAILPRVPSTDKAPVLAAQGRLSEAAGEVEKAGLMAAAAIYRERAADWIAARALWSRLCHATESGEDVYVAALVRFNLARCARQCGDSDQARQSIAASVRLLEEAADHFESLGQRERAFDCFQVLVQVGRESGAFEDVLEGFVNSIRILREDHLEYDFALELLDAAIAAAAEHGESRAAATLARQAVEYARSMGLAALAGDYALKQAQLWCAVAQQQHARQASPETAENALRSAVVAFAEIGQYARVGELYLQLSQLDLDPSRREHYAQAAKRYEGITDEPLATSGERRRLPKREPHQPDVWHVDVLEWERKGSAAEACMDVLIDRRHEAAYFRRKAMLARLTALRLEGALKGEREPPAPEAWLGTMRVHLAEQLGEIHLYAALSPLEALFHRGERRVKVAVLRALERMCFKRTFLTVRAALRDPDPAVVHQATETVSALCFSTAVDPLSRIMTESSQPAVRVAALRALSRIDTLEAAELVLGVLEHGTPADREAALGAIKDTRGTKLRELARGALLRSTGALRATLLELLS